MDFSLHHSSLLVSGSSLFKVKEDDEVDGLEIKMEVTQASKRIYRTPSRESLNAKTGLFSKRMKIIHQDPLLHAQRSAAIKRTKTTPAARRRAAEISKAYFSDPENRLKRSLAMKGVTFYCSYCGEEGHRRHYCKALRKISTEIRFMCSLCGERGHNRRTCLRSTATKKESNTHQSRPRHCNLCGQTGHYRTTCAQLIKMEACSSGLQGAQTVKANKRSYFCKLCLGKGHNKRACPDRKGTLQTSTKTAVPEQSATTVLAATAKDLHRRARLQVEVRSQSPPRTSGFVGNCSFAVCSHWNPERASSRAPAIPALQSACDCTEVCKRSSARRTSSLSHPLKL
ncbi:hypothetical protein KSP39_PZI004930 [Platanthera zijinensis]|uniref:CCHC-type domain-containing protein n=1 Tax=Platanthera zijinensis TaxID=2320716 RepID=A0AAP0GCQ5_9ASPA